MAGFAEGGSEGDVIAWGTRAFDPMMVELDPAELTITEVMRMKLVLGWALRVPSPKGPLAVKVEEGLVVEEPEESAEMIPVEMTKIVVALTLDEVMISIVVVASSLLESEMEATTWPSGKVKYLFVVSQQPISGRLASQQ